MKKENYTCLFFAEGRKDKNFLNKLVGLDKFEYHTKNWFITLDNASGTSPEVILKQCESRVLGYEYDLILCFIDLDKLKHDFPKNWEKEKLKLETSYLRFQIIWQIDSAEDEYKKVIGDVDCGKHRLNKIAKEQITEFINSDYWNRIINLLKSREKELDDILMKLRK